MGARRECKREAETKASTTRDFQSAVGLLRSKIKDSSTPLERDAGVDQVFLIQLLIKAFVIFLVLLSVFIVFIYLLRRIRPAKEGLSQTMPFTLNDKEMPELPEIPIAWPVTIEVSSGKTKSVTKYVGTGGSFIICQDPLPLKSQFLLTFDVPKHGPLTLVAEVVWSNVNVPDDKIVTRGMAVKYIQIPDLDRRILDTAISDIQRESRKDG